MAESDFLVVGLGNPGVAYGRNRHNLGYLVVEAVAEGLGWSFKREWRLKGQKTQGTYEGKRLHLLKPTTYMNLSGQAVHRCIEYYQIPLAQILIIVDDVYLKLGNMRLRPSGGSGGHNGLKSIEAALQTQDYARLRMGIGGEEPREQLEAFVLGDFTAPEREQVTQLLPHGVAVIKSWITEGVVAATSLAALLSVKNDRTD